METSHTNVARFAVYAASLVVVAAAWEIVGGRVDPVFLVPLSEVLVRLVELIVSGELPLALLSSLQVFAAGLAAGVLVGAPSGLLLARVRFLRVGAEDYVTALYATPMVALIPFILAIFGFGFVPKVIVVFLFAVFPVVITPSRVREASTGGSSRSPTRSVRPSGRSGGTSCSPTRSRSS